MGPVSLLASESTTGSPISLQSPEHSSTRVTCMQEASFGLFQQCQNIQILQENKSVTKAYGLFSKKFLNLAPHKVYALSPISEKEGPQKDEKLLIPGELLWSKASLHTYGICRFQQMKTKDLIEVQCGEKEFRKVHRSKVFRLLKEVSGDKDSLS